MFNNNDELRVAVQHRESTCRSHDTHNKLRLSQSQSLLEYAS